METYHFIIKHAPYDIINYIHEFEHPKTTYIITKLQKIEKMYMDAILMIENMKKLK